MRVARMFDQAFPIILPYIKKTWEGLGTRIVYEFHDNYISFIHATIKTPTLTLNFSMHM